MDNIRRYNLCAFRKWSCHPSSFRHHRNQYRRIRPWCVWRGRHHRIKPSWSWFHYHRRFFPNGHRGNQHHLNFLINHHKRTNNRSIIWPFWWSLEYWRRINTFFWRIIIFWYSEFCKFNRICTMTNNMDLTNIKRIILRNLNREQVRG